MEGKVRQLDRLGLWLWEYTTAAGYMVLTTKQRARLESQVSLYSSRPAPIALSLPARPYAQNVPQLPQTAPPPTKNQVGSVGDTSYSNHDRAELWAPPLLVKLQPQPNNRPCW